MAKKAKSNTDERVNRVSMRIGMIDIEIEADDPEEMKQVIGEAFESVLAPIRKALSEAGVTLK